MCVCVCACGARRVHRRRVASSPWCRSLVVVRLLLWWAVVCGGGGGGRACGVGGARGVRVFVCVLCVRAGSFVIRLVFLHHAAYV